MSEPLYLLNKEQVKKFLKGQYVHLQIDESTDKAENIVLNVIFIANGRTLLLEVCFLDKAANHQTIKECMSKVCEMFEIDLEKLVSVPTDSTGYMQKGVNEWIKQMKLKAKKISCSTHLTDPELNTILQCKKTENLLICIRAVFAKHHYKIKKSFIEFLETMQVETGFPYCKKSTRAWGTVWRSVDDLLQTVVESKGETKEITKLELIYAFLLKCEIDDNEKKVTIQRAIQVIEDFGIEQHVMHMKICRKLANPLFNSIIHLQGRDYSTIHFVRKFWKDSIETFKQKDFPPEVGSVYRNGSKKIWRLQEDFKPTVLKVMNQASSNLKRRWEICFEPNANLFNCTQILDPYSAKEVLELVDYEVFSFEFEHLFKEIDQQEIKIEFEKYI